jgi:cyclophilin family peptidyl-prolyl cis-trans isomerase
MAMRCMRAAVGVWLMATASVCFAQVPAVETHPHDPAKAKQEFEAARKQEKDLIAELTLLQAEYQQPGADQKAIAASLRLPEKRFQPRRSGWRRRLSRWPWPTPKNPSARELCGLVIASRLQMDDAVDAIKLATILDKAGVTDGNIDMMAAAAAMMLSQLDEAADWLTKAEANGIQKQKVAELRASIENERPKVAAEMASRKADAEADDRPRVTITTSKGDIVVELFEDAAPNTVANFISLVEKGFYDGTPFHRVIGGFMAQGGDPTGTGSGGPGYVIDCECELPGARKHFLGSLSMAHAGKNTGGSQFFLTFRPTEHLDGKHTVFGRVIQGFDVMPKLARTQREDGQPIPGLEPDTIVKAKVLRKRDHAYEPKTSPDPRK